eukprot:6212352-Pleurochrysis_carterae.AAC.3
MGKTEPLERHAVFGSCVCTHLNVRDASRDRGKVTEQVLVKPRTRQKHRKPSTLSCSTHLEFPSCRSATSQVIWFRLHFDNLRHSMPRPAPPADEQRRAQYQQSHL